MRNHNHQAAVVGYHQQGAALLMIVLALIAIASALSYQYFRDMNQKLLRKNNEAAIQALQDAKQSLLFFATSEPTVYANTDPAKVPGVGHLPCPDMNNDGTPDVVACNTSTSNVIGRFPHQQTSNYFLFSQFVNKGLGDVGGRYSIWYAVTGYDGLDVDFRQVTNGGTSILNSTVVKTLQSKSCGNGVVCLDGKPVVAVLVLAGDAINGQNRSNPTDYKAYLDQANGDNDPWNFVSVPNSSSCAYADSRLCFNDRVVAITIKDWVDAMEQRVRSDRDLVDLCDYEKTDADGNVIPNTPLPATHWLIRNAWKDIICQTTP